MSSVTTSESHGVTHQEIDIDILHAYKILGGEWTINSIISSLSSSHEDTNTTQNDDWQALYLQFKQDHVLGTLPYRWEPKCYTWDRDSGPTAFTESQLLSVTFNKLHVVVLDGEIFCDGAVSGSEKASIVKQVLCMDKDEPLMEALGRAGKVAAIRETVDEWELLVPLCLLRELVVEERVVARFKRHPHMPVTWKWCEGGGCDRWKGWEDGTVLDCVPDIVPVWTGSPSQ